MKLQDFSGSVRSLVYDRYPSQMIDQKSGTLPALAETTHNDVAFMISAAANLSQRQRGVRVESDSALSFHAFAVAFLTWSLPALRVKFDLTDLRARSLDYDSCRGGERQLDYRSDQSFQGRRSS